MAMTTVAAMYLFNDSVISDDEYLFLQELITSDGYNSLFLGDMIFQPVELTELQKSFTMTLMLENQKSL